MGLAEIEALGLNTYTGAYVISVVPGGPADQAGIRAGETATSIPGLNAGGDLITAMDGQPIASFDEIVELSCDQQIAGRHCCINCAA